MRHCNYSDCIDMSGITVIIHHTDRPDETLTFCAELHAAQELIFRGGGDLSLIDDVERRRALGITAKARIA